MMKVCLLLLVALCYVADCQVSKKCQKANKAYPGNVQARPATVPSVAACSMFTESCCSMITEFYMKEEADKFMTLAGAGLTAKLSKTNSAIESNSLTKTVFSQDFNDLVKMEGSVSYQELARVALKHYVQDSCATDALTVELINRITPFVKMIADPLKAIYVGLDAIKSALEIATEYKTSDNCRVAIMQNGVNTDNVFSINKCQVCERDTAALRPCKNTCMNAARGCLSDLTEMGNLLEDLANALDVANYNLIKEIERVDGSLEYIEMEVQGIFDARPSYAGDCSTGAANLFVASGSQVQPANFTAKPLELKDAFIKSFDYVCLLSAINTNCWTSAGLTAEDTSVIIPFTSHNQAYNPILARETVQDESVVNGETVLRTTLQLVNQANAGYSVFVMEEELEVPDMGGETDITDEDTGGEPTEPTEAEVTVLVTEGETEEPTVGAPDVVDGGETDVVDGGETDVVDGGETDVINGGDNAGETDVIDGGDNAGETDVVDGGDNAGETDVVDGGDEDDENETGEDDGYDVDDMNDVDSAGSEVEDPKEVKGTTSSAAVLLTSIATLIITSLLSNV